jgi:hypothetical protein
MVFAANIFTHALFFLVVNLVTANGNVRGMTKGTSAEKASHFPGNNKGTGNRNNNGAKGCSEAVQLAKAMAGLTSDVVCDMFSTFDNMGRGENNDPSTPLDWPSLCDDFESLDPYLCPSGGDLNAICSHPKPQLNPSVKLNYCEPLFRDMSNSATKNACIRMCINYVSKAEGNCCAFECAPGSYDN